MLPETNKNTWLDRPIFKAVPGITVEIVLVTIIMLLAVVSRFYNVGARVMSHDEVNHVVPSYNYSQGQVYRYDPVTHGPLQFHMIALSYFLFGSSDAASRLPAVVLSIAAIAIVLFAYRRYLGRAGAIVAGLLFLISPYMLFYGRYARNEAYIIVWTVMLIYSVLRFLETGQKKYLLLFTLATALHFIDKATSYIFAAEMLLFLTLFFIERVSRRKWVIPQNLNYFIGLFLVSILFAGAGLGLSTLSKSNSTPAAPLAPGASAAPAAPLTGLSAVAHFGVPILLLFTLLCAIAAIYFLIKGLGWKAMRDERSFDLLMLQITLVLPMLGALPIKLLGFDPLDYSSAGVLRAVLFILPLGIIAVLVGFWWGRFTFIKCAAIFWGLFTVFYTSFFTNGSGFATGLVGALGYWMAQQAVNRGTQPWYYYIFTQIPMYEYLSFLGLLLAVYLGFRKRLWLNQPGDPHQAVISPVSTSEIEPFPVIIPEPDSTMQPADTLLLENQIEPPVQAETDLNEAALDVEETPEFSGLPEFRPVPALALLVFWSFSSLLAFSVAGEKMPWLTIHIACPMLLASGWGLGYLIDTTQWERLRANKGLLVVLILTVFLASLAGMVASLMSGTLPFQGKELVQLESTASFVMSLVAAVASGAVLARLVVDWSLQDLRRLIVLTFFALLAVFTARTAFRAAYINYDTAKEFLVYAHAARGPKDALAQIEEISYRTTQGKDLVVAYDNDMLYPYWWYLRQYPNAKYYADKPTRDILNAPVIVAGEANFTKVDALTGSAYYRFDYQRLWWPTEDYKNLDLNRIIGAIINPQLREGIFDIWFNADYTVYATATNNNKSLTLENWSPSNRFRLYIRKDIVSQMWTYGAAPVAQPAAVDPYAKGTIQLSANQMVTVPNQLQSPRQVAVAKDGSLYIADSGASRILHLSADGTVLKTWGTFADIAQGAAPGGTFNQPWGVAIGLDGSVFVADTWNHRIEKFTADGQFIKMWGHLGDGSANDSFYGPRGLAVDPQGRLLVVDTGNKRVEIFDADGNFITLFGDTGSDPGQFDEPVGVAVGQDGLVYVTDTWNVRMQVFQPDSAGMIFTPLRQWTISGWLSQSVEDKPFVAVDSQHVFVTDPEGYRILEFTLAGDFVHAWGDYGTDAAGIGLASGIAIDAQGGVWLSDTANNRLLHYIVPSP